MWDGNSFVLYSCFYVPLEYYDDKDFKKVKENLCMELKKR
jgi:hypothetical protein